MAGRARRRRADPGGHRVERITVRLSAAEAAVVREAAAAAGETVAGYLARMGLGGSGSGPVEVGAVARLLLQVQSELELARAAGRLVDPDLGAAVAQAVELALAVLARARH